MICQPDPIMHWRPFIPGKATLVLLFMAAKRRLTEQTDDIAELPNARIITATEELNQITDDIRDAQDTLDEPPLVIQKEPPLDIHTVGKILRRSPR